MVGANSCSASAFGIIKEGAEVLAYEKSSVPFGESCQSETRKCTDRVLTGSFEHSSCSVEANQATRLFTKDNIPVAISHPRTYLSKEAFDERLALCYGPSADSRCANFFQTLILTPVAAANANTLLGYKDVFAYKAIGSEELKERAIAATNKLIDDMLAVTSFTPDGSEILLAIDIMWPELERPAKLKFLEAIQKNNYFEYNSHLSVRTKKYGYHSAGSAHRQLAASLIIWDDPIMHDPVVLNNPSVYLKWNPEDYIYAIFRQIAISRSVVTI